MAEVQIQEFDRRARRIVKRHQRLAKGCDTYVGKNGIVELRPTRSVPQISMSGFFMVFVALLCFKAFLFGTLGPQTYQDRVDKLAAGTVIEKAGAFVMSPEPVTLWIVDTYREVL